MKLTMSEPESRCQDQSASVKFPQQSSHPTARISSLLDWKNPNDRRERRVVTLSNELEVLLISDPQVKKSAAAIDVNVGSLAEPDDQLGLAHFLEHVLFLGTEKYPVAGEYQTYLQAHQGHSNAFTASEHTNYYLEVSHAAFDQALDRFAEFFVAPLLSPEFIARERNSVHSEYQKNLKDDAWRLSQLQRHFRHPAHPESRFTIGSHATLGGTTREHLQAFFTEHYSANVMKAVLIGNESLDRLESLAYKHFSRIANNRRAPLTFSHEHFDHAELPRIIRAEPIKDMRRLSLSFPLPCLREYSTTRPHAVLVHLVGHEARGSLLSLLRKRGLATELSASASGTSYGGTFDVTISLTRAGVERHEEIIELVFAYLNLLRREGYRPHTFHELRTMAEINYAFREFEEGGDLASRYARLMHEFPALELDQHTRLLAARSEEDFFHFLNFMRPQNLQAFLVARGLGGTEIEPWFQVHHSATAVSAATTARWAHAQPPDELAYPEPNPFIPNDLSLLMDDPQEGPRAIFDNERGSFYFQQDREFNVPKARLELNLITPALSAGPRERLLALLYERALSESLVEWKYDITLAGLHFAVVTDARAVRLLLGGYAQHLPMLLHHLIDRLHDLEIDEQTFATLKDNVQRELTSHALSPAYVQGVYELRHVSNKLGFHIRSFEKHLPSITLAEVVEFAHERLFTEVGIEGAAFGNLHAEQVQAAVESIHAKLEASPLPHSRCPREGTIRLAQGHPVAVTLRTQDNNNAYAIYHVTGTHSPRTAAITRLMNSYLSNRFFNELRTRQQLGYVVISDRFANHTTQGMVFLVQSDTHCAGVLAARARAWLDGEARTVEEHLSDEQFEESKAAIVVPLRTPDKTQDERLGTILSGAYIHRGNFEYRQAIADAVEATTRADLVSAIRLMAEPRTANSFAVYVAKDGEAEPKVSPLEKHVRDSDTFRRLTPTWADLSEQTDPERYGGVADSRIA